MSFVSKFSNLCACCREITPLMKLHRWKKRAGFFGELSLHLQRNPQVSGSEPEAPSPYDTRHLIASLHEEV